MPNYYTYDQLSTPEKRSAKCSLCEYCDYKQQQKDFYGKITYKCTAPGSRDKRVKLTDDFCRRGIISKENYKKLDGFHPSGWFIVTKICEILGKPDNCEIYYTTVQLKWFILKNEEYLSIWKEYESIGPIIAEKLDEAENKHYICFYMFFNYLIPCAHSVRRADIAKTEEEANECYTKALLIYIEMIIAFQKMFNIPNDIPSISEYLKERKGTGRVRITHDNTETQQ